MARMDKKSQNSFMWDPVEETEIVFLAEYVGDVIPIFKKISKASSVKEEIRFIQYDPRE